MYKRLLLSLLFLNTTIFLMSSKPPLPKEAFHPERAPYELLDHALKARPFTQIDSLDELLEDYTLSKSQEEALEKLKKDQELLIETTKATYLTEIERLKYILFNKSFYIQRTIQEYRETLPALINQTLQDDIHAFRESLRRRQRE